MDKQEKINEDLDAAYREMAQDEKRETEALEWAEAIIGDVGELAESTDNKPA